MLLCPGDSMFVERLRLAIGLRMETTGLLYMALSDQTKPLRRYFAVRMLLHMAHTHAEVRRLCLQAKLQLHGTVASCRLNHVAR